MRQRGPARTRPGLGLPGAYGGLTVDRTVRIEVTDTRGENVPLLSADPSPDGESGRGLLLVAALADRWGCSPRAGGGPGKTVWAECTPYPA
ncbi:ATP-binding protein [Streptomyces sp. NPDC013953]|uniref:ATP-binding protein n=1 Tax=Streptomyces sp. NPDC013953 TaxID=3364868 RepID=UPI0036FA9674